MQIDYKYLCHGLGHLTGLEIRVYLEQELIEHYAHYPFEPDIAGIISDRASQNQDNAFYVETEELLVFGAIRARQDNRLLIIGPTSHIRPGKQAMLSILYQLAGSHQQLPELEQYFANMVPYPFENFLEILCFVNYAVNEEKLTVSQLIRRNDDFNFSTSSQIEAADKWYENNQQQEAPPHNTYEAEKIMMSYITTGDVEAVKAFFEKPPTGRIGPIALNELRQRRNTHIIAAALMSRAAIAGGMTPEAAFAISDRYIQKVEMLSSGRDITQLGMEMMLDYTRRVEAIKCGEENSRLARDIKRYIHNNINRKIKLSDIAEALDINRSYMCERFKQDTGRTINEFITLVKVDEAKRMLRITNHTIAQISDYLAFSSQSYFQNVFKKIEGCTPREYRERRTSERNIFK